MRINYFPKAKEPNNKSAGQKQKKLDAVTRIDAAIKTALDELESYPDRRAAFLCLLACVRAQTGLLKRKPPGSCMVSGGSGGCKVAG